MAVNEVVIDICEHSMLLDGTKKRVQCNYCDKIVSGIYRLKCHLGGIGTDVLHCKQVSSNIKEAFATMLLKKKKKYLSKEVGQLYHPNISLKRNWSPSPHSNGVPKENNNVGNSKQKRVKRAQHNKNIKYVGTPTENSSPSPHSNGVPKENNNVGNSKQKRVKRVQHSKNIKYVGTPTENSSSLEVQKCIGRFFYETGINFRAAEAPSFKTMVDAIRKSCDEGECSRLLPNYQQLRGTILKDEVKETQCYVNEVKSSWKNTGCSILLDGWTDGDGNNLINIIVDCPKGPIYLRSLDISSAFLNVDSLVEMLDQVIEDVGVENVVQIVTYCTLTCMEKVGKQLTEKYKSFFWVVGASHCLDLMLESMCELDLVRGIMEKAKTITRFLYRSSPLLKLMRNFTKRYNLVRPSKIISATPILTLKNILKERENLKEMFSSSEWGSSIWASSAEGKRVADMVITDHSFWNEVTMVVKATIPITKVMGLIYKADKKDPQLGLIYETIDQVKETIREQVNIKTDYMPFWEIIDDVWNNKLHSPLHSAAYFLNPSFLYSGDFCADAEIASGLLCYIVRLTKTKHAQDSVSLQIDAYREAGGSFKEGCSRLSNISPDIWWSTYGVDSPELQRLAIRALSQTCDGASKYQLRRDLAEELLREEGRRNPIEEQRLRDLAFVHYNLQLRNFDPSVNTVKTEEIDPRSDWIVDDNVGDDDILVRSNVKTAATSRKENVKEGCSSAFPKEETLI